MAMDVTSSKYKKIPLLRSSGALPDLISATQLLFTPESLFKKARRLNSEIFSFRVGTEPWIFLSGKEAIRFFGQLNTEDIDVFEFRNRMFTLRLPGADAPTNLPNVTRATNKVMKEYFEALGEEELTKEFVDITTEYLQNHLAKTGTIENFYRFIVEAYTNIVGTVFLGKEIFATLPKDHGSIYADIEASLSVLPMIFPVFSGKHKKQTNIAKHKLVDELLHLVQQREDKNKITYPLPDVIDRYITLQAEFGLTDGNIIWLYNSLQWAAVHYCSVHAFWICVEIFTYQNLLTHLLAEQKQFADLNWVNVQKMRLMNGTVRESLRMNSIFLLARRVLRDIEYKDYLIPKKSVIAISPFYEHHNPVIYENPSKFNPTRWDVDIDSEVYTSFVPGGIGFFGCIGMNFAIHFLTTFWAVLIRHYRLEFPDPPPKVQRRIILLAPSAPVPVKYWQSTF